MLKIISTLLIIILLASCSKDGTDNNEINQGTQNSEIKAEDFVLRIFSDAETYQAGEIITIWAEFTYIGEEPYIEIFHAMPYLTFTIVGENDFGMSALQVLVLANTTLYRDEIQRFDFAKSGGFGEDDEDADFWRAFFDDPKLRLPAGEYTISANAEFSLSEVNLISTRINLRSGLTITVLD